jgi:hypothetical protein
MRAIRQLVPLVLALAALSLFAGCGDDESPPIDTGRPFVIDTSPADGATDVSPYPVVEVSFSEPMDLATIDTLTFYIEGLRAHSIAYDSTEYKATLYPAGLAEAGTEYDVHVEGEIKDAQGTAMEQEAVFSFTTGASDCAHLGDRFEPDDAIASATPVEIDVVYPGLTSCGSAERNDYYRFTLSEARTVVVWTEIAYADTEHVDWKVYFRREDGEPYGWMVIAAGAAGWATAYSHSFLPGTYWAEIGNYREGHIILYNLKVTTLPPAVDDEYEDNDFPDEAKPIEAGLHEGLRGAGVDSDYFSIGLTAGQTLTITVTEDPATSVTRRVEIASATGSTYAGGAYDEGPVVVSWTAAQTGTHLIYVRWWADDIVYSLNVEVTP